MFSPFMFCENITENVKKRDRLKADFPTFFSPYFLHTFTCDVWVHHHRLWGFSLCVWTVRAGVELDGMGERGGTMIQKMLLVNENPHFCIVEQNAFIQKVHVKRHDRGGCREKPFFFFTQFSLQPHPHSQPWEMKSDFHLRMCRSRSSTYPI